MTSPVSTFWTAHGITSAASGRRASFVKSSAGASPSSNWLTVVMSMLLNARGPSWPHRARLRAERGLHHGLGGADEIDRHRAGLPRVDQVMQAERLGPGEGAAVLLMLRLQLCPPGL